MESSRPNFDLKSWGEVFACRRSVRRYSDEPLPSPVIDRLLDAMSWAPSAHNRQPWRVAVIDDYSWKCRLAGEMGKRLRSDRQADGDAETVIEQDIKRSYARIAAAPVVLVICVDMADMDVYPDELRRQAEYLMATQSVAMAAQNLLLRAHIEGVGACWLCAPLFCRETVTSTLTLPSGWEPQALITLGWPANQGKVRTRVPPAKFSWRPEGLPNL